MRFGEREKNGVPEATLHEAHRLVSPAERVLVPVEEGGDGEEQLRVQRVHLLLRRLLDLVDVQRRAEEHGDVDAPRQWQVEAAPVEEERRLRPEGCCKGCIE